MKSRLTYRWLFGSILVAGLISLAARGSHGPFDDPQDEEAEMRKLVAKRSVGESCTVCHALDLVEAQRLTPKQWKTEVDKMIGWGAFLPPEQVAPVVDYLSTDFPVSAKPAPQKKLVAAVALDLIRPEPFAAAAPKGDPHRGATLYAKNCANCHGADAQGADLGPNLVERPYLLRPTEFAGLVRQGVGRMPGFLAILDATGETDLLAWLRERRYQGKAAK